MRIPTRCGLDPIFVCQVARKKKSADEKNTVLVVLDFYQYLQISFSPRSFEAFFFVIDRNIILFNLGKLMIIENKKFLMREIDFRKKCAVAGMFAVTMLGRCVYSAPLQIDPESDAMFTNSRIAEEERLIKLSQKHIPALGTSWKAANNTVSISKTFMAGSRLSLYRPTVWQEPRTSPNSPAPSAGAGGVEIDEAAAQRALERTLTQLGALLLQPFTIELTPVFSYAQYERTSSTIGSITVPGGGSPVVTIVPQHARVNETAVGFAARLGLPHDLQAELFIPYSHIHGLRTDDFGNATSARGNALGDITVGIARTFLREKGWGPDLIGRFSYNAGNGRLADDLLAFSGGYRQLQAQLIALKRQDPLAFTVDASFIKTFERRGLQPGNGLSVSAGVALAASPETSLQLNYRQVWRDDVKLAGRGSPGTSQNYGILSIGASSVLSRDLTVVTQFGIGLGQDAPKYTVSVAFPFLIRK